jgi:hypothetical protein
LCKWSARWIDARFVVLLRAGGCEVDINVQLSILGSDRLKKGAKMKGDGRRRGVGMKTGEGRWIAVWRRIEGVRRSRDTDLKSAAAVRNEGRRKNIVVRKLSALRRGQQGSGPWRSAKGKRIWRQRTTETDGLIGRRWLECVQIPP